MTTSTLRLHHADSWLFSFDGVVTAHATFNGHPSVVLDQTAFYPESGGQLFDTGTLAGLPVTNVQVDDDGVVHHLLTGNLPAVGATVHGEIDRPRRRVHMALHTAQHMLSAALLESAHGETVSARLGETGCTIDLNLEKIGDAELQRAEDVVNGIIDDDRVIRAFFPSETELRALPLRRAPKVEHNIRVVQVEGFDVSPCGGTHCTRTGQVGMVKVTGVERYKGKIRVNFDAGKRARDVLWAESNALHTLGREFTCGALEVSASVDKMRRELTSTRETLGLMRSRVAHSEGDAILRRAQSEGRNNVVAVLDDGDPEFLRAVVKRVASHPQRAMLLAGRTAEGITLVFSRGETSTFDCGAALKKVAQDGGGRGGGKPTHAEGRLPTGADVLALTSWITG